VPISHAEANQGDQGVPHDRAPQGRPICQDKEVEEREEPDQVQGSLQPLPVHPRRRRQG